MRINGVEAEYIVLSDPGPAKPISPLRRPNVLSDESKIILDGDRRPAVVMNLDAFERWQSEGTFEEQRLELGNMWEAVRRFDSAAIEHLPFLITAQQFVGLIHEGGFDLDYCCIMPDAG
jgi:hypothetical protein